MHTQAKHLLVILCILFVFPTISHATTEDPVIQTIEKALTEYKNKDFSNASSSLDYASQLIRQKKGEALAKLLPAPLDGWKANKGSAQVTAASLFGGGLTARKRYTKGNSVVEIAIVTDSPLLQSMIMMFSNPIFAAAAGQFELINGFKGIVNFQQEGGDINIVVNNRFLITLKGKKLTRNTLMSYAKVIDLQAISKLP